MLEAKLFDEKDCVMRGQLITKTAEETAAFLLNHCDGDNQRLTVLMAKFAADAVFDQNPGELLYWACVHAHCKNASHDEIAQQELLSLLDHWKTRSH
jgi:hypothetical protein